MVNTPSRLNAGDSLEWVASFAGFPASQGWSLIYVLTNATNSYTTEFVVSPLGDDFAVSVSAAASANLVTGDYSFFAVASKGAQRQTVAETRFRVLPAVTTLHDRRTQAERTLEAIEALLEGKADDLPEQAFFLAGTLDQVRENAAKLTE